MRSVLATVLVSGALGAGSGCGDEAPAPVAALPRTGEAYRALDDSERLAVAARCRERAVAAAGDVAARELAEVEPKALRDQLDAAFRLRSEQRRPVAEQCARQLPFVTPGAHVGFEGAKQGGGVFSYETDSDVPLWIRGAIDPAPRGGVVVARRESGGARAYRARVRPDGRFELPAIRLRKVADNTFVVAIETPPSAPRKVYFSAICLDCLGTGAPPASD